MIGMDQYDYIRTAKRVYKKSIKEICRETGHSRTTVRQVLRNEFS
jgi:predicted transcriptional regulator